MNNLNVTTSKIIAKAFKRPHRNILRDIRLLACSDEFKRQNFIESNYISNRNKSYPYYEISREGAMLLCMGFNGGESLRLKEEFLLAMHKKDIGTILESLANIDIDLDIDMYIYFAREEVSGRYKIGISKDPERRIKELNVGNPEKLILDYTYLTNGNGFESESIAHERFKRHRLNGEWFDKSIKIGI